MEFKNLTEQIKYNEEKFIKYNNAKINLLNNTISKTHKIIFEIIPFLLHTDQFGLPGFMEGKKVPIGIMNYNVNDKVIYNIQRIFKNWKYEPHKNYKPFIQLFAVIGSCGSIAHNNKSDYDYWVVVNKNEVNEEMLNNFQEKLIMIEKWLSSNFGIEVHFFINDIEQLKRNIFANTEEEAFGSAIGLLLKDEFFRTSIFIAGKIPLWWLLPANINNKEYEEIAKQIINEKNDSKYIDIGNTVSLDIKDFYGAFLFQIIKTLSSPFKSIMKISLLEKYISQKENEIILLSSKLKNKIQQNILEFNVIDSYLFLFEDIMEYYELQKKEMADLIKICFYLKVAPNITPYLTKKEEEIKLLKTRIMKKYIEQWGWNENVIKNLDNFEYWEFHKVYKLYEKIKAFIINTYNTISSKIDKSNLHLKLNENDKLLIKRKINSFFLKEPDKVERIFSFYDNAYEKVIIFEPAITKTNKKMWILYRIIISGNSIIKKIPLRSSENVLELVIWAAINGIFNQYITRLKFTTIKERFTVIRIKEILTELSSYFNMKKISISNKALLNEANILRLTLIINFGSEETDKLENYDIIYLNSWGEVFVKQYNNYKTFLVILGDILKKAELMKKNFKDFVLILLPENYGEYLIKIKKLVQNIYNYFLFDNPYSDIAEINNISKTYIFRFEDRFAFLLKDKTYKVKYLTNEEEIFENICNITNKYFHIKFDNFFSINNPYLEVLSDYFKIGNIQIFIAKNGIIISNENNKLLYIPDKLLTSKKEYIIALSAFIDNIIKIIRYINYSSLLHKYKSPYQLFIAQYIDEKNVEYKQIQLVEIFKLEDTEIKFINSQLIIINEDRFNIKVKDIIIEIKKEKEKIKIINEVEFNNWKENNKEIKIWISEIKIEKLSLFEEKELDTSYFIDLKISLEKILN
ncbi:MAG TPA: class I adenylate cyclase [bacterium]|nr:class I adenylate cyclase [bacterium]HOL46721.1 class I adenylate cyclase [bacterium]HPQ18157.1 class I adenylate cyclase [bacterium]